MSKVNIVVFVTTKDKREARKIAQVLLREKLIACANIISGVESHFVWQNKLDQSREHLLILKTRQPLFAQLTKRVKALHSYQTPEVIALPITEGSKEYLEWIQQNVWS